MKVHKIKSKVRKIKSKVRKLEEIPIHGWVQFKVTSNVMEMMQQGKARDARNKLQNC